jgi:Fungal fucose-specific lectin
MISTPIYPATERRLYFGLCILSVLISLAALPSFGQQIHQLSYNGSNWADQNLNGLSAQWAISAFFTTPNDQLHVFFGGLKNPQLYQLFNNRSSWADLDLGPHTDLCFYCGISGFSEANYQYVFYVGGDLDIHRMLYHNVDWVDTDLTLASGASATSDPASNLVAFTTSPALHVYYTSSDSQVHQLFATNGSNWQDQDLTVLSGGPGATPAYGMAGFNIGNFQYVYYLATNNHLHQLFYNDSSWTDQDLTVLTKTSPTATFANVSALVIPGTKKMRVYFVSASNGHIIQLASTNNAKWSSVDLTKRARGSVPDEQIVAFPSASGGTVNVYYVSGHNVNRTYQPTATTWTNENLTALTNGGVADSVDQLAGFSLQGNQYLYYMAD